jgi:serine phosphatase RsbU (regulator of sigma subunit)/tellurite resistance protein
MVDLAAWTVGDLVRACAGLRTATAGSASVEEAAGRIVTFLRETFTDGDRSAFVLTRLFVTAQLGELPDDLRAYARARLDGAGGDPQCLALIATAGDEPAWCDRRCSVDHQVIPLTSVPGVERAPMVASLVRELGMGLDELVTGVHDPSALRGQKDFDVFHVPVAAGSPSVPAQDFVARYGVASALGFGGLLPNGQLFAVMLFSRVPLSESAADLFRTVAVSAKLALLQLLDTPLFTGQQQRFMPSLLTAEARIAALEQMLAVQEKTAAEQSARVQQSLRELRESDARARHEAEISDILNRVGSSLAEELDLDRVVQHATDAAVQVTRAAFGAFFYNVTGPSGESYTLYTLSGAPREAFSKFPMPRNTAIFGPTFRGEGVMRLHDVTADPRYGRSAPYHGMPPGHLPVRGYLAVPVVSRTGEVIGGFFFGHPEPGVFDERAERLAVGIAAQTAVAMDNARLFRQQRDTAVELQRHLLPREVVAPVGMELGYRYVPGAAGVEVGGDWYDVLILDDETVGLVVGDVMGRGVRAAATMGQLRVAVSTLARLHLGPARVLEELNKVVLDLPDEQIVTCTYAEYARDTATLTVANAGHVPLVIVTPGGEVAAVGEGLGPPLGVPDTRFAQRELTLSPGSQLLLYTDGLVENRQRSASEGVEELVRILPTLTGDPGTVCDKVVESLTPDGQHDDDVAVLLARTAP